MKIHAAILFALTIATGCAHAAGSPSAVSAVSHSEVAGEIAESEACGPASMQTHFFHGSDGLEKRVIDRQRCGVVELRVVDVLDVAADTHTREILRDVDHDGQFERRVVERERLQGSFALLAQTKVAGGASSR